MRSRANKAKIACLISSAVAIGLTFTMLSKHKHSDDAVTRTEQPDTLAKR